jgi:hypothetical protein
MTPKEKSQNIVNSMMRTGDPYHTECICFEIAKRCALIAVDEIIEEILENWYGEYINIEWEKDRIEYWQEVKQEIQKL